MKGLCYFAKKMQSCMSVMKSINKRANAFNCVNIVIQPQKAF